MDVCPCSVLLALQSIACLLLPLCRRVAYRHPNLVEQFIPMNCPHPRYVYTYLMFSFVLYSPLGALVCRYKSVLRVGPRLEFYMTTIPPHIHKCMVHRKLLCLTFVVHLLIPAHTCVHMLQLMFVLTIVLVYSIIFMNVHTSSWCFYPSTNAYPGSPSMHSTYIKVIIHHNTHMHAPLF